MCSKCPTRATFSALEEITWKGERALLEKYATLRIFSRTMASQLRVSPRQSIVYYTAIAIHHACAAGCSCLVLCLRKTYSLRRLFPHILKTKTLQEFCEVTLHSQGGDCVQDLALCRTLPRSSDSRLYRSQPNVRGWTLFILLIHSFPIFFPNMHQLLRSMVYMSRMPVGGDGGQSKLGRRVGDGPKCTTGVDSDGSPVQVSEVEGIHGRNNLTLRRQTHKRSDCLAGRWCCYSCKQ